MRTELTFDFVVAGGGLAGVCCAIAAARQGLKTAIIQDRPVFGGNSSSEIRVVPAGSANFHSWQMEAGIVGELMMEDRASNHEVFKDGAINVLYDLCLYNAVQREPNLTAFLNTAATDVELEIYVDSDGKEKKRITGVYAFQSGSGRHFLFKASQFADCTGDGILAYKAGAEYRYGREARREYGENLAPVEADNIVMGSSLNFYAKNTGKPVPFNPPSWAKSFTVEEGLGIERGVDNKTSERISGYWWLEIGPPYHTTDDNEIIRDQLYSYVLGIWDYLKNQDPVYRKLLENFAIDWIGAVPGKRESRRFIGDVVVTEQDIMNNTPWYDSVATSGCYIDIHIKGGILNREEPPELAFIDYNYRNYTLAPVHTIPLRALYCKDVENLWLAGRHMSFSRVAMAADRLQLTLGSIGQSVGTAAALAASKGLKPRQLANKKECIKELQQILLKEDQQILGIRNEDPEDLALEGKASATSQAPLDFGQAAAESGESLETPWRQVFPVTTDKIHTLAFYLTNKSGLSQTVRLELSRLSNIWDNGDGHPVKSISFILEPFFSGWKEVPIHADLTPGHPYCAALYASGQVFWHRSGKTPVGTLAQYHASSSGGCEEKNRNVPSFHPSQLQIPAFSKWNEMRTNDRFCLSIRVTPVQMPYGPENVNNGFGRPYAMPNIWISDPDQALPQALQLDFEGKKHIKNVQLLFDTNLNVRYTGMPGFWKAPECVKDWNLYAWIDGEWKKVYEERGNYLRKRLAAFEPVLTERIKIEILATNGDSSARIYEVRVY